MKHDRALSKLRTNKISYLLQNFQRAVYGNCGLLYKLNSSVSLLTMIALRCQNCFKMALLSFKYFYFPSNNFPFLQRFLPPFFFLLSFKYFCSPSVFIQIIFAFLQMFLFSFKYFSFPSNIFFLIFFKYILLSFSIHSNIFCCFPSNIFFRFSSNTFFLLSCKDIHFLPMKYILLSFR